MTQTTSGRAFGRLRSSWRRTRPASSSASASGVLPLSGTRRRHSEASRRLRVGRSATVASGTPLLKATTDTRSPRAAASSSSRKTSPFTCSTRRSAWSEYELSTTKHTSRGTRCSRTLRRTSSAATANGCPRRPALTAAARIVASNAMSRSRRRGDPGTRVLAATQRHERPVTAADRPSLEPVGRRGPIEHASRVDLELCDARPGLELV